jgi:hypothetical protein
MEVMVTCAKHPKEKRAVLEGTGRKEVKLVKS